MLGLLGACAALACGMPRWLALPLALLSAIRGPWLARRYLRAPVRAIAWPMDGNPTIDGTRVEGAQLHWRGPLACLRYRDAAGRDHRLAWWPDTLPGRQRRELRLAAASAPTPVAVASMAP
jgi:toxin CptA